MRAALVVLLTIVGSFVGGLVMFTVCVFAFGLDDLEPAAAVSSPAPTVTQQATSQPTAEAAVPATSSRAAEKEAEGARSERAQARAEEGKRIAAEKKAAAEEAAAEKAAAKKATEEKAAAEKAAAEEAAAGKAAAEKAAAEERSAVKRAAAEKRAAAATLTVVAIVDGDTVDVSNGARIRIAGIDTPERGECGYDESGARMTELARDRDAVLVRAGADSIDRYGRLIRYLEVDGRDVGLTLIEEGLAIARYDSRDGYGWHDREATYVAADAASPQAYSCQAAPTPEPAPQPAPQPAPGPAPQPPVGGGTDPQFGSCKEAIAHGYGPYVVGVHPEYHWYRDGDSDGTVCET